MKLVILGMTITGLLVGCGCGKQSSDNFQPFNNESLVNEYTNGRFEIISEFRLFDIPPRIGPLAFGDNPNSDQIWYDHVDKSCYLAIVSKDFKGGLSLIPKPCPSNFVPIHKTSFHSTTEKKI